MTTLPSATTRLSDQSGGLATGTELLCCWAPVLKNADNTPRLYSSSQACYDTHDYSRGVDYLATHIAETNLPCLFVPLPITTPGTVGRFDSSGNTNTCAVTVAVAAGGSLDECDGVVRVVQGGVRGTDQIILSISMDGGRSYQTVKLGTATSYTIPYFGQVLSFGAGSLTAGDTVLTWHSTAPKAGASDIAAAKIKLLAQTKQVRSWLYHGDLSVAGDVTAIKAAIDTYETSGERYALCKCSLRDRNPQALLSKLTVRMTGSPTLTFANASDSDTITRNDTGTGGSFIADGFVAGDLVAVTGAATGGNNVTAAPIVTVAAGVLTFGVTTTLTNEGPKAGCTLTATPSLTFAETGTNDTITLSRGSWLDDGFRTGDLVTIVSSVSNNITTTLPVTITSALVMTMGGVADDLAAEVIGMSSVTITAGETDAAAVAALDSAFAATVDRRLDLGYGRGAMLSPITGYSLRRPVQWADTLLAYKRDINQTTWHKDKGPIASRLGCGFDLNDVDGNPFEHDERVDGGALAAGFTCARTWGNGPEGAFIAQSRTRNATGPLNHTSNMYVACLGQQVVQRTTENFAGATLLLNAADALGKRTATGASLKEFESKVNGELTRYMLGNLGGEGPRASICHWYAATDDDLGIDDAILNGTLDLQLNGILCHIATSVRVR